MYMLKDKNSNIFLDENSIVLDIETTGVSRTHSSVVVVGILDSNYFYQYAIEDLDKEKDLLETIFSHLNKKHIITFNGDNFDIPFLKSRFKHFNLKIFKENSSFDIYRYFISNRLFLDNKKFSLQEIEKFYELERRENFELDDDKIFYKEINNIDLSNIMLHNRYDVINTYQLLPIIKKIDIEKTIKFEYKNNSYNSKIDDIYIDKNFLILDFSFKNIDLDYRIENDIYYIDWSNDKLNIKIKVIEGYLDDDTLGYCHIVTDERLNILDKSKFSLPKNIISIFTDIYHLDNIKNIISEIFTLYINNWR